MMMDETHISMKWIWSHTHEENEEIGKQMNRAENYESQAIFIVKSTIFVFLLLTKTKI